MLVGMFPTVCVGNSMVFFKKRGDKLLNQPWDLSSDYVKRLERFAKHKAGITECRVDSKYCNDNEPISTELTQTHKWLFLNLMLTTDTPKQN